MAGESPDKSDKKQSSGKTARSERDPRLSAFRGEPDESAKESGSGKNPKPEDGAEAAAEPKPAPAPESTAEAKPAAKAAKQAAKAKSGAKSTSGAKAKPGPDSAEKPESGAEPASADGPGAGAESGSERAPEEPQGAEEGAEGSGGGDERLRAAVAAWVAGKDDEDAEGDAEAGEDGDGGADAAAPSDAESEAASGAKSGAEAGEKAGSGAAEKAGAEASEVSEGADGGAEGAAAKGEAKAEARAAVASDVEAAPEADAGPEADGDADAGRGGSEAGAKSQPEPKGKSEPKGESEPKGKGKSESKAEPEAEPASGDKPASGAQGESRSKGAEVVDQPTAVFKTVGPQKGKPGGAAAAAGAGKGDGNGDGKGDGKGGEEAAAGTEESAVDNATRVFAFANLKGEGAEAVDQATTAFKISPPAKGGDAVTSKAKDKAEAKGKPESTGKPGSKGTSDATDKAGAKGTDKAGAKDKAGAESSSGSKSASKPEAKTAAKKDSKTEGKEESKPEAKDEAKTANVAERDSERTSQFVALKSADDGTAGKSLGKTAPKTPARTPDKADDKADKAEDKPGEKASDKAGAKPAGKATGALPAAEPAKSAKAAAPTAPSKPADRPGAMPPATTGAPSELPETERTKQQPLPPLDLLAQLTNTPPPPETPLRTVVRRFKIWTPLAVLLVIIFVIAQAVRPLPDPTFTVGDAKSSFTFEGGKLTVPWPAEGQAAVKVVGSGDVGTFGPQKPVPTASVAKIMTAYVVLRDHPLKKGKPGPQVEVDAKAVTEGGSTDESRIEGLRAGQKFSQQDMLKMLMIPSGNNIARLLARWDTQSANEGAFVKKMNAAAKDLGMKNTTYTDPSGLDPKTVSTAVDQLKLAEAVMKFDAFRPIVAMTNAEIPGLPGRINNNNDNLLLEPGLSIKGIKTGSSTAAGGTLSWAAYKTVDGKDRLILGTMLDQHFKGLDPNAGNSLTMVKNNSQKVIAAVREALTSATAVKKGQVVGYVDDGLGGLTPVVATKDLKAVGVPGQKLTLSVGDGGKTVPHTAKAGTEVGVLTVGNGESMQKVPVALQKDLVEPSFGAKLIRIT
ncbi:D-alanyl-D-alanine carboxypeptidase [Streptomyces platensis subsp. clarensis]|nr:D-alanyl-D-alanine carboxypeptidase [Streptomyces platensis subsp. clarensis]